MVFITADPVTILQAGHFATIARHFSGLRIENDIDIFQAADFILQDLVGFHFRRELQQGHMFYQTSQIDGRFNAGVTAADNRHAFTFKQRAVAVWAIGHPFGAVLILTRHVHVAPFCPGGDDHAACFQHRAGGRFNLVQAAFYRSRNQFRCALRVNHIHSIVADVRF